ncbi:MAG: bifunctional ornithine acetyltransferase/N-acetylglutamate synthase, partial [Lachnospiraceae bacterium]|nr:bifunctional ornithine acetyltransferase/N-acetylglutamate synthase [Lachnospiraceae bacterium]
MKVIEGGVTAPKGFSAMGIAAGIKKDRKDMAMIYSEAKCHAAGTFTTNIVKAAPVKWDQAIVYGNKAAHAVVVNSGVANACTGEEGLGYCKRTAQKAAALFGISENEVLVASTGVIGKQIPIEKIEAGIETMKPMLADTDVAGTLAAEAIMTTDTVKKEVAVTFEAGGKTVTLGGMCKG